MQILIGASIGLAAWFLLRFVLMGLYTVDQNERAVKTSFGRAIRVTGGKTTLDDYMRYRAQMLKMGVSLSELSPVANRKFDMLGDFRSSLGALHAKVAVVDRRWLVVGSMNMDGR